MKFSFDKVYLLHVMNILISLLLLGFGISVIVFGLRIPPNKCKHDNRKDCLTAHNGNKDIYNTVNIVRIQSIVIGFLLIIPVVINILQASLSHVPGSSPITSFLNRIVNTTKV